MAWPYPLPCSNTLYYRVEVVQVVDWVKDDGGRAAAGYRGTAGDCVTRAAAIVTGRPYQEIYEIVNILGAGEKLRSRNKRRVTTARNGVSKKVTRQLMEYLGGVWTPTMGIGTGCRVHLDPDELPYGRIVASVSKHVVAVIDGRIHDTHDPSREGTRCVYGYWVFPEVA